jgi:hypothetical protein
MNLAKSAIGVLLCSCLIGSSLAGDSWIVREDGVGPVKVGMSLSRLNVNLHEKFEFPKDKEDQGCFYVNPGKHPQISLMIENGRLVRIDVRRPGVLASEGLQVGDSEVKARKVYGSKMKVTGHKYIDTGHYLTVGSDDHHYGIRFETDQGRITMFYAGIYEAIQYVEGCQ